MPAQLPDVERTPLDTPQLPFRDLYAYVTRAAMPRLQAGNSLVKEGGTGQNSIARISDG